MGRRAKGYCLWFQGRADGRVKNKDAIFNMSPIRIFTVTIFLLAALPAYAQNWQWTNIKTGPFSPGYTTIVIKSYHRPFSTHPVTPRVLPIHVWYPSTQFSGATMKFFDFVTAEKNPAWGGLSASESLRSIVEQHVDSADVLNITQKLKEITSVSILHAAIPRKKFPVVMLGTGLSAPGYFFTLLAEYLASHGYVVISFPSIQENLTEKFTFNQRGLLNQVEDMELVLNEIATLPYADINRLALAAWSVGGAAQILFQMKHRIAKAAISLDAASQYMYGKDLLIHSVYFDSSAFTIPFLNLSAAAKPKFFVQRSNYFADTVAANKTEFSFPGLSHSDFLSFKQYVQMLNRQAGNTKEPYEESCERIKLFLDANLTKQE